MICRTPWARRRRGFIILFGSKNVVSPDPTAARVPQAQCPRCGQVGTLAGKQVRAWFTLFFLPLFPMGAGRKFTRCGRCGASFSGAVRQVASVVDRGGARQQQRAISLYNGMRASPANSVALNELMALYLSMGEFAQAVGAAADFPDALNASEQCMVTLSRAYMAAGKGDEAISWLDTALARNPESGEAHYHRAMAYLNGSPPDADRAVASARAARKADFPGSAELLAAAEARARGDGV